MRTIIFLVALALITKSGVAQVQNASDSGGRSYGRATNEVTTAGFVGPSTRSGAQTYDARRPIESARAWAYRDTAVEISIDSATGPTNAACWAVIALLLGLSVPVLNCCTAISWSVIEDLIERQASDLMADEPEES